MSNYLPHEIPMDKILSDDEFNCRGRIAPYDVATLAKDIEENELQFPISVQPIEEATGTFPDRFEYRIIAGHRRHMAFKVLKRTHIPAMIKRGLSEVQARVYNLSENLQRSELNIMQEAKALEKLKELGLVQEQAAEAIGRNRSWVQVRYNLLELPDVIQQEAAAGILNQAQIKQIYGFKRKSDDPKKVQEMQFEAVRAIKNALLRGQKGVSVKKAKDDPFKKKRRAKNEIEEMVRHIGRSGPGFGFATRCLAWANGEINTAELDFDIKKECGKIGKTYFNRLLKIQKEEAEASAT
jgi:ParB family chromosome partitioning protein